MLFKSIKKHFIYFLRRDIDVGLINLTNSSYKGGFQREVNSQPPFLDQNYLFINLSISLTML